MAKWICLLLAWTALMNSATAGEAPVIRIGAIEEYPLNTIGVRVLREAYGKLNQPFLISEWPSPRSLEMANNGRLDGEMGRIAGLEREYPNLKAIQVPLLTLEFVAVTANPDLAAIPPSRLKEFQIGISPGMRLYDAFSLPEQKVEQPGTAGQLLRMLIAGRVDFALVPLSLARYWEESSARPLHILPGTLARFEIYHYLNIRHAALAGRLQAELQTMQREGRLKLIENDYMRHLAQD